ncbi:YciI family protein [Mangrovicoccus algicola]|uniref:YCII-related domain-containing protein n=1 Tax=Mangrovicoccus algicola TaxID=2771008 RepID=A0A8J7CI79_9RHOB|nr:YciI family protein [Mangrovicoccus algicola]MBE3639255.1 hypothetical protein [Mangrovicoccus algicola]
MAYFLMTCLHHEDPAQAREVLRPRHRAWVGSGGEGRVSVLIGSALTDAAGASIGNFAILEAPDSATARAFAEGDPFARAGLVSSIEITPLPPGFQAHRIAEPMSPRLG